jgi:hypothetical protein
MEELNIVLLLLWPRPLIMQRVILLASRRVLNTPFTRSQRQVWVFQPLVPLRDFSSPTFLWKETPSSRARALNKESAEEHEDQVKSQIDIKVGHAEERQLRAPWHREESDAPPVRHLRSAGTRTKGYLSEL